MWRVAFWHQSVTPDEATTKLREQKLKDKTQTSSTITPQEVLDYALANSITDVDEALSRLKKDREENKGHQTYEINADGTLTDAELLRLHGRKKHKSGVMEGYT